MWTKLRSRSVIGLAIAALIAAACSSSPDQTSNPDGYTGGTKPLNLLQAPPGLCSGNGSQKECETPGGCKGSGGNGSGGFSSGSGGSGAFGGSAGTSSTGGFGGSQFDSGSAGSSGSAGDSGSCDGAADAEGGPGCGTDAGDAGAGDAGPGPQADWSFPKAAGSACASVDKTSPATLFMSADDSNSTASPVIARSLINRGQTVPAGVVRPWEFLNYYNFEFEPAAVGQVRIVPQLSSCPKNGELSLQIALQSEQRSNERRAALNLTFVLDTSGSMGGSPIALEEAAVLAAAKQLRAGDIVSMVTWSTSQADILSGHVVTGPNDPAIVNAAHNLSASGGTDLSAGLTRGYKLAQQFYGKDRINRVLLISDGGANVGITDEELIGKHADDEEGQTGIYLSGVGVGDGVNDTLMNAVTDAGRGAYIYLDDANEADKMLNQRFLQSIDLAARAVRLEVTLPWYMKVQKFFGEQISTDPTKVRPQHLGPNDAMLFFQILQACDAKLIHGDDKIRIRATWETPFTREKREAVVLSQLNDLAGDDADLTKAAAIASFAEALITADSSDEAGVAALKDALDNVQKAKGSTTDPDLIEVAGLIIKYLTILGTTP